MGRTDTIIRRYDPWGKHSQLGLAFGASRFGTNTGVRAISGAPLLATKRRRSLLWKRCLFAFDLKKDNRE